MTVDNAEVNISPLIQSSEDSKNESSEKRLLTKKSYLKVLISQSRICRQALSMTAQATM